MNCRRSATRPDSRAGSRSSTGTACTATPSTSRPSRRAPAARFGLVQVVARRERRRGAEAPVDGEDVVLLHELVRQRHGVGRVVTVVVVLEVDLPPVDAAVGVHVREVRVLGLRDDAVQRCRPGQRECAADRDRPSPSRRAWPHSRRTLPTTMTVAERDERERESAPIVLLIIWPPCLGEASGL